MVAAMAALGRKQPVPLPAGGVTTVIRSEMKWVAAIRKIWWAQPGAVVTFVASFSGSHNLAQSAGQEIHQRRHPWRQRALLVEHGPYGLGPWQGVLFQHRHQAPHRN